MCIRSVFEVKEYKFALWPVDRSDDEESIARNIQIHYFQLYKDNDVSNQALVIQNFRMIANELAFWRVNSAHVKGYSSRILVANEPS